MKTTNKIKFFAAAVLFLTVFSINAQNLNNSSAGSQVFAVYQGNTNNGCINIKFNLNEDCYAVLYAVDTKTGNKTILVDGDISKGFHGVMFKTADTAAGSYVCVLEAYDTATDILLNKTETLIKCN